jgi:hypothetical protein
VSEETNEEFDSRYDRLLKEGAEVADRLDKLNNFLNGSRRNTIPDNQIMFKRTPVGACIPLDLLLTLFAHLTHPFLL